MYRLATEITLLKLYTDITAGHKVNIKSDIIRPFHANFTELAHTYLYFSQPQPIKSSILN